MNKFYQQEKHSNQKLNDHHNNENKIYQDPFVVQVIQNCQLKNLDSEHNSNDHSSQPFVDQHKSTSNLSNEISSNDTDKNDNKNELSTNVDESDKSLLTMKKRVTPIPASYARRRPNLINQSSNPKLLSPRNKTNVTNTKKSTPIFIAPKKTSPPPHSFASLSFDDSLQIKRKPISERRTTLVDDRNSTPTSPTSPTSSMRNWTPAPPVHFHGHSSGSSLDENSSDENDHQSLFIRKKSPKIKKTQRQYNASFPICTNIPSAIFITDPYGRSHTFDPDNDNHGIENTIDHNEQTSNNDLNSNDTNTLYPHNTADSFSTPEIVLIPPTPPVILDKHMLQSIGEEEEEENEDNNQKKLNLHKKDENQSNNEPLDRRWSDGVVDQEKEQLPPSKSLLIKMASAISVSKQPESPPVKFSKTKYLLMKLHLTSSSKDDEPNNPPPTERTVRRSTDKKHSRLKLTTNDSNSRLHESSSTLIPDGSNEQLSQPRKSETSQLYDSRNTLTRDSNQQLNQSRKSETSQLYGSQNTLTHGSNQQLDKSKKSETSQLHESSNTLASQGSNQKLNVSKKPDKFTSVGNLNVIDDNDNDSDDDIDGTFEKAKLSLQKRASSFIDIRGSQASLNSVLSDTKARYGLDISGTIELKLTYALKTGALDVLINKCTNLAKASKLRTSNPYVKIYLLPDHSKHSKRKTAIKKNTVDPIFEEKFRYHVTKHDFETRVLWISVWSQTSVGHNDFLGEIHIPLAHCTLDKIEEFKLLAKKHKNDLAPTIEPTMDPGEIKFELTFLENRKAKGIGILQVRNVEGKSIFHGKNPVKAVCKGLLMPYNIKQKLVTIREGPTPRWELPLRWEGVRLDSLQNISIEISIWNQEPFRKTNLGFVRLNLAHGHFDNKPAKWLDSTNAEKAAWQAFIDKPTEVHQIKLPLRPATAENK